MEVYYTTCISSLVYFCLYFESSDSIYQLVNINRREIPERKKVEGFNQTKKKKNTQKSFATRKVALRMSCA